MTGQRFGRLYVDSLAGKTALKRGRPAYLWHCVCDCGNEVDVIGDYLRAGNTSSCGCLKREMVAEKNYKHGKAQRGNVSPIYYVWETIIKRCENPRYHAYKDYGHRGITVCAAWHDIDAFEKWAIANGWKKGLDIDRIDNDGNYEPGNCRFVTRKANANNRRSCVYVDVEGVSHTITEWADLLNVSRRHFYYLKSKGKPLDEEVKRLLPAQERRETSG